MLKDLPTSFEMNIISCFLVQFSYLGVDNWFGRCEHRRSRHTCCWNRLGNWLVYRRLFCGRLSHFTVMICKLYLLLLYFSLFLNFIALSLVFILMQKVDWTGVFLTKYVVMSMHTTKIWRLWPYMKITWFQCSTIYTFCSQNTKKGRWYIYSCSLVFLNPLMCYSKLSR